MNCSECQRLTTEWRTLCQLRQKSRSALELATLTGGSEYEATSIAASDAQIDCGLAAAELAAHLRMHSADLDSGSIYSHAKGIRTSNRSGVQRLSRISLPRRSHPK